MMTILPLAIAAINAMLGSSRDVQPFDSNWRFITAADVTRGLDPSPAGVGFSYFAKSGFAAGPADPKFDDSRWQTVQLPHDWAVGLAFASNASGSHGFKALGKSFPGNSIGWYRKSFSVPSSDVGKKVELTFDGVYRDADFWVNGFYLGRNQSGYSSCKFDISDFLRDKGPNVIAVRVDATEEEGWWYEGAGIYRHVWLTATDRVHVDDDSVFVRTHTQRSAARVDADFAVENEESKRTKVSVIQKVLDNQGRVIAESTAQTVTVEPGGRASGTRRFVIHKPILWEPGRPYLYRLVTTVKSGSRVLDEHTTRFGVRSVELTADRGLSLNDRRIQIKGVCIHQDHAGVGTAIPGELHYWRLLQLRSMGVNAIRMSHNAASPELLDLCDELGFLVLAENREYGTNAHQIDQLIAQIRHYRNHPSIFAWSLGNEEWAMEGNEIGAKVTARMQTVARATDPTRLTTVAISGGWGKGSSTTIDVMGYNYFTHGSVDDFHRQFPAKPSIGTEDGATFSTRGVYVEDRNHGYLTAYDKNKADWNLLAEESLKFYDSHKFVAGQFQWTGFDYRGEPAPFGWPNTVSQFGIMDLCGFPKDNFYYYKAWWSDEPVLHILPHWNWPGREGQPIEVWVHSNDEEVDLLLNGKSLGRKKVARLTHLEWSVPYEPGTLEAVGYRDGKVRGHEIMETTGPAVALKLTPQYVGRLCVIKVSAVDAQGREVLTASNHFHLRLANATLLGVGNGDPSSHESDVLPERSLFNGLAQAILTRTTEAEIFADSDGLKSASLHLSAPSASDGYHADR